MKAQGTNKVQSMAVAALLAALLATAAALLAGGGTPAAAQEPEPDSERPNIVLIESDDQTQDSMRFMPQTRKLIGGRGATFADSFATWPLCCPSRATLFTGQYPHNHGVLGNRGAPLGGFDRLKSETALPVWLENAGYYTAHIGKYLNGYEESNVGVPPGWTEWHGSKDTYRFYGYDLLEDGEWVQYGDQTEDPDNPAKPETYSTDVYTDKAVNLIGDRAPRDQPFFLSLAYLAPHGGNPQTTADGSPSICNQTAKPAIRHLGRLQSVPLPVPPNFNERDVSDKPVAVRERQLMGSQAIARAARNYRCRAESLLAMDEGVKRIIGALRSSGELDNTLVIYTSDNGFFHGEHRVVSGKNRVYEEGIRVPLLMRGPDIPKDVTVKEMAGNIDLAPTIADAAEAKPLVNVDGRSLLRLAKKPDRYVGREMLLEQFSGIAEAGEENSGVYQAIRTPRFKYVENATGELELYDLKVDPYELENQIGNPDYAEIEAALATRLRKQADCEGAECKLKPRVNMKVKAKKRKPKGKCYLAKNFRVRIPRARNVPGLLSAEFRVEGKKAGVVKRSPFKKKLRPSLLRKSKKPQIEVTVELIDGRKLTLFDRYKICR